MTSVSLIFLARCKTKPYQKSNGKNFCGYAVKVALNWQQAFDYCKISGGRLPEVYNLKDNVNILQQKVNTGPCFIKKVSVEYIIVFTLIKHYCPNVDCSVFWEDGTQ